MAGKTGYLICRRADTLLPHRVLCDSGGRLWIFFQNSYRSLSCGYSDDRGGSWSPAADLLEDVSGPFSACADNGRIHLAARNRHPQDVHHLEGNDGEWRGRLVYSAHRNGATTYFPLVRCHDGIVHLVFAARKYSSNSWSVVHVREGPGGSDGSGGFELPGPAGVVSGWEKGMGFLAESLFWSAGLALDGRGRLHLAYRAFWLDGYHLFYTFTGPGDPRWAGPERLTGGERCEGPPSIHVHRDRVYLLYRSNGNGRPFIRTLVKDPDIWRPGPAIPLEGIGETLAEGFLPGEPDPGIYWADRTAFRAMPFSGSGPSLFFKPEGGEINTLSAAPAGISLALAWTRKEDPRREICFEMIENHL